MPEVPPERWPSADAEGRRLLGMLAALDLPRADHAVFGSGPFIVRGIVPTGSDLDVICRGPAWEAVRGIGTVHEDRLHGVTLIHLHDGALSFGTSWGIGRFDVDDLIDTAEDIDGVPFVRLSAVAEYKRIAGRPKDIDHLHRFDEWLRATSVRDGSRRRTDDGSSS